MYNTCRTSLHICPVWVKNCMPAIHSRVLNRVSLAKSCMCVTNRSSTYFSLGSGPCELMAIVFSVIFSIVRSIKGGTLTLDGSILGYEGNGR